MARRNRDLVQILDEHERSIRRLKQSLARAGSGDHGNLTGLGDNDHPQYALLTGAVFTGNVEANDGIGSSFTAHGTIAGGYWAGSIDFTNTDGATTWRVGVRGDSDVGDGGNLYFEYYTGSAYEEWLNFDHAANELQLGYDLSIRGSLSRGITIWNTTSWGAIEIGGTSGGYIDFKNAEADDFDMRIIMLSNDELKVDGGGLEVAGHIDPSANAVYDLGDATDSWRDLYVYTLKDEAGAQVLDMNVCRFHKHVDPGANNAYDLGDSALTWRGLYVHNIYDEDGSLRIDVQGSPGTLFYNESAVLKMSIGGNGVTFHDERFVTAAMGPTGSSAHNATVYDAVTYQEYRFTSKRDAKKNIRDLDPALSEGIYDLTLRTFDMRKANQIGRAYADLGQHGMIADEVHAVFGDQAAAPDEHGEPAGWSERFMVTMLLQEAQKSKRHSIAQDARIEALEAALHRLNNHRH